MPVTRSGPATDPAAAESGAPPPARRARTWRYVAAAAVLLLLGGAGYLVHSAGVEWGYFTPRASVGTLPLVEVPAPPSSADRDAVVVLLSADGGWARLDRELAERLAAAGYPVVGWNSLRYYSTPRTPAVAADDLVAVMRTYQHKWHRHKVLLVGYSFGADVLPIMVDMLPEGERRHVAGVVLLGFWKTAEFKFRPGEWVGRETGVTHYPTLPAVRRLGDVPVLCIGGDHDRRSVCARIGTPNVRSVTIPAGHSLGAHADQVFRLMAPMLHALGDE